MKIEDIRIGEVYRLNKAIYNSHLIIVDDIACASPYLIYASAVDEHIGFDNKLILYAHELS